MRTLELPRAELSLSRKCGYEERRDSDARWCLRADSPWALADSRDGPERSRDETLKKGSILARRREVQLHAVNDQIHGNGVVQRNLHQLLRRKDFDLFARHGDVQLLRGLINGCANLVFRVVIHDREPRLLLHFVGELIFAELHGNDFELGVRDKYKGRGP